MMIRDDEREESGTGCSARSDQHAVAFPCSPCAVWVELDPADCTRAALDLVAGVTFQLSGGVVVQASDVVPEHGRVDGGRQWQVELE